MPNIKSAKKRVKTSAKKAENNNVIREMEEKKRNLKGIEICQNCGAELKRDANFCNVCGVKVQRISENTLSRCLNCGSLIKLGEKFCSNCGTQIEHPLSMPEQSAQKLICVNCGKELKPGFAFCQYCGTAVTGTNIETESLNEDNTELKI